MVIVNTHDRAEDDSGALFFRQSSDLSCEKIRMYLSSIGRVPKLGVRLYFSGKTQSSSDGRLESLDSDTAWEWK